MIHPGPSPSQLLASLEEANSKFPLDRKLLVCRERGEGRELLRALALRTGGWMGWEATTLRDVAGELAFVRLSEQGLRTLEEVELAAVVDTSLDRVLERLGPESRLAPHADGTGFRQAVGDTIRDLRLAGVSPDLVREALGRGRGAEIALLYETYVEELRARTTADAAAVFEAALAAFDDEVELLQARIFFLPGLRVRGVPGRLLARLLERGAAVVAVDPVYGLDCPPGLEAPPSVGSADDLAGRLDLLLDPRPVETSDRTTLLAWLHDPAALPPTARRLPLEMFRAASPAVELREILRRVLSNGTAWDQVEIVATDPLTYGAALDTLAGALGIPVTFGVGLPLERSRVGRILATYLRWLEEGLQARPIWEALDRGELQSPRVGASRPSSSAAARVFRSLRIGWSRQRYCEALADIPRRRARLSESLGARQDLDEEERARRLARGDLELQSIELILRVLLAAAPAEMPEQGKRSNVRSVSPAAVARGALEFLTLFRPESGTEEEEALGRVRERLETLSVVADRSTTLGRAVADVRAQLRIRVPRAGTRGALPWSSAAGALHITDVTHGGRSARPHTFVVGLDADRTASLSAQDPLLADSERRRLSRRLSGPGSAPGLATSEDLFDERRYELASMLAGLRGAVTLSYAAWDAGTGSALSPSPILLQALRVRSGDARGILTFEDLEEELQEPVSLVPPAGVTLDATDVWMRLLRGGSLSPQALELVGKSYTLLGEGLRAESFRTGNALTPYQGHLPDARVLETHLRKRAVSPSAVEQFGRCPLSWLYKYGLGIRKPEDPDYDPSRWLTPLEKGALLHTVFERFGLECQRLALDIGSPEADVLLERLAEKELERARAEIPSPSAMAREFDAEEMRQSCRLFLAMERELADGRWERFELEFGGVDQPASVRLPGGRLLPVIGKVDRVDRLESGRLRVVDYKTGSIESFERESGAPFDGGRKLQPAIYVPVLQEILGEPVQAFEYRFPTERGQLRPSRFDAIQVQAGLAVVESLIEMAEAGLFLATDDKNKDCRFCDYGPICRVTRGEFGVVVSPRADWSRERRNNLEYGVMVRLRTKA